MATEAVSEWSREQTANPEEVGWNPCETFMPVLTQDVLLAGLTTAHGHGSKAAERQDSMNPESWSLDQAEEGTPDIRTRQIFRRMQKSARRGTNARTPGVGSADDRLRKTEGRSPNARSPRLWSAVARSAVVRTASREPDS